MSNKILDEIVSVQNVVMDIREALHELSTLAETPQNLNLLTSLKNGLQHYLVVIYSQQKTALKRDQVK